MQEIHISSPLMVVRVLSLVKIEQVIIQQCSFCCFPLFLRECWGLDDLKKALKERYQDQSV